jgi:hypothetical protein
VFFQFIKQRIVTEPNNKRNYDLFNYALEEGFDCVLIYVEALSNVDKKKFPPAVKESLKGLVDKYSEFSQFTTNKEPKIKS